MGITSLIICDVERSLSGKRFWLFVGTLIAIFLVSSFISSRTLAFSPEDPNVTASTNQILFLFQLPFWYGAITGLGWSYLFVFGMPFVCGDFTAKDLSTGQWDIYRSKGVSVYGLLASRLISLFLTTCFAGVLIVGLGVMGSSIFFTGELSSCYSQSTLINSTISFMPQVAEYNIFFYWGLISFIYVLLAWGVLCFCALLGIVWESVQLSMVVPAVSLFLINELTYNAYTSKLFCYMAYDFPSWGYQRWSQVKVLTIQLPVTIILFIAGSFLALAVRIRME